MEKDQRLTPLPNIGGKDLQTAPQDYPASYAPFYDDETFDEKRSLRQYFNIVYKRLPIILALTILTTAAAAFYMYRQPSEYQARTEMLIEPRRPKVQSKDSININFGGDANYYQTQLQLLQNAELMKTVVINLGLHRQPNLFGNQNKGVMATIRSIFSSDKSVENSGNSLPVLNGTSDAVVNSETVTLTPEEKSRVEQYAGTFLGNLTVVQTQGTNIVNVSVKSTIPELAARVADNVAETFIAQNTERETQGAKDAYEELSRSIVELQTTIQQKEQERINEMRMNNLPLANKGEELAASILQKKSDEWLNAESERRKIQQLYEAALQANQKGEIYAVLGENNRFINSAREQNLRLKADLEKRIDDIDKQINDVETDKAALLVKYTAEHPEVKKIEAKINTLNENKERIQSEVSKKIETEGKALEKNAEREVLAGLLAQLQSSQKREAQARASYVSEISSANQAGQAATRLTTLTQAIETQRGLLNTYTQRQKEQELAITGSRPDNIKISSHAITPTSPIGPQRTRNITVAFLISLAAGIGLAFLMDYLDDSVRTSDDVGRHLGLPTLALIPHHNTIDKRSAALVATNGNGNGNGNGSMALITLKDRRSPIAEAYRHLRTSLLFSSAGKPPQTILVTSSQPSEGKTTTAINTAITLAQSDVDVVIIDCDLRRPRLHNHFGLENTHGLTNYLSGERNTENLLKPYKDLPRLKVITSGPIPPNPAELLSSNEMKNLLQFLRGNFKHIVIDSPPAISFTDAAILSTLVDGVVLVAMAGKSSIHLMRRFKQRLGNLGARIYGVVLNGIKANSAEYDYYGYGYTYSYYTAAHDDDSTPVMEEVSSIHDTKG
jgi:capsular exopolysaccharide synthesis family protein